MATVFQYISGEDIRRGDEVRYHGERGTVEFVAEEKIGNPELDWYIDEYGGGFMISAEKFGRVFLTSNDIDDFLTFVKRSG